MSDSGASSLGADSFERHNKAGTARQGKVPAWNQRGGKGGGLVSYVEWLGEDRIVGTALLRAVLPFEASVRTTVEQVLTVEQLDEHLSKSGLPRSAELFAKPAFAIDYRGSPNPDEEPETLESEPPPAASDKSTD